MKPSPEAAEKLAAKKTSEDTIYPYFRKVFMYTSLPLLIWLLLFTFMEIKDLFTLRENSLFLVDSALFVAFLFAGAILLVSAKIALAIIGDFRK